MMATKPRLLPIRTKLRENHSYSWKVLIWLICANAQGYKPTQAIKFIEREIFEIKSNSLEPVTALDFLGDGVVEPAFLNIWKLLCLYVLILQLAKYLKVALFICTNSAIGCCCRKRFFSKMKLIMTDKRTRLELESLDSLIRISYNSKPLSTEEVNAINEFWKISRSCRIFSEDF